MNVASRSIFFFSSRRRHTRCSRDWSSDVCSSDLQNLFTDFLEHGHRYNVPVIPMYDVGTNAPELIAEFAALNAVEKVLIGSSRRGVLHHMLKRSEERRVGKECRYGWWPDH